MSVGTLALGDGSNGGLAANYTLSGGTHQLTVNQRPLNATLSRQYDASTTAAGVCAAESLASEAGSTRILTFLEKEAKLLPFFEKNGKRKTKRRTFLRDHFNYDTFIKNSSINTTTMIIARSILGKFCPIKFSNLEV